ncbi:MAG: hypothetical protein WCL38_00415, partial [Actinomycetota bacterium]
IDLVTAGTLAHEGQPMSSRTKTAIASLPGLEDLPLGRHRSHQLTSGDVEWADVILCMEADHVRYVRRVHPDGAAKAAIIIDVAEVLEGGDQPLLDRVLSLQLQDRDLSVSAEVEDPAGGDQEDYHSCAAQVFSYCQQLISRL